MAPQAYKVVNTHAHEISGWKIISRLLHTHDHHIKGMNGDVQCLYLSQTGIHVPKECPYLVGYFHTVAEERVELGSLT